MSSEIIVVGGGASGLMAAITAASSGSKVTILEHKDKLGKKILATGNGKCNYTNYHQTSDCYRGTEPGFAMKVYEQFDVDQTVEFFRKLGIFPKVRNGYVYPSSSQAASVLDVLLLEAMHQKVNMQVNQNVTGIKKKADKFVVTTDTNSYTADKVILAAGGCAAQKLGSDGSGYQIARSCGHGIVKPLPALVQLKSNAKYLKTVNGVRTDAAIQVRLDGKRCASETGEILFANYGISGIPIMQLSRFVAEGLDRKKKAEVVIDFVPELSDQEVLDQILERVRRCGYRTAEELFLGWFNHKLTYVLLKEAGIDPVGNAAKVRTDAWKKLALMIKGFTMNIVDTNGFENAQTSAGGVFTSEIDEMTMESKKMPGLYLAGEVIDIDGTCGGYNLQWAWSSGYVAGRSASRS